jgi:hypothetical protein
MTLSVWGLYEYSVDDSIIKNSEQLVEWKLAGKVEVGILFGHTNRKPTTSVGSHILSRSVG